MADANTYLYTSSYTPGNVANVSAEILAPSTKPIRILRVDITQQSSITAADTAVAFRVCSAATTGWTSPTTITPVKLNPSDAASGSTCKSYNAAGTTSDGTGTTYHQYGFDVRAGLFYLPTPNEWLVIPAANYFVVKFTVAPPAATVFDLNIIYSELG